MVGANAAELNRTHAQTRLVRGLGGSLSIVSHAADEGHLDRRDDLANHVAGIANQKARDVHDQIYGRLLHSAVEQSRRINPEIAQLSALIRYIPTEFYRPETHRSQNRR